jgi:hypothetical protein
LESSSSILQSNITVVPKKSIASKYIAANINGFQSSDLRPTNGGRRPLADDEGIESDPEGTDVAGERKRVARESRSSRALDGREPQFWALSPVEHCAANPKSDTFCCPYSSRTTFACLMSRCVIPSPWQCERARMI